MGIMVPAAAVQDLSESRTPLIYHAAIDDPTPSGAPAAAGGA